MVFRGQERQTVECMVSCHFNPSIRTIHLVISKGLAMSFAGRELPADFDKSITYQNSICDYVNRLERTSEI
jgi:hypothetical protein